MEGFDLILAHEELNQLRIEGIHAKSMEVLREVLHSFMPLKSVLRAVPIARTYKKKGIWRYSQRSKVNSNIIDPYLKKISTQRFETILKNVKNSF